MSAPTSKAPLQGIGGWLLALTILQCFFAFLLGFSILKSFWDLVFGWPGVPATVSRIFVVWLIALHGSLLGVASFVIFLLSERRARFVKVLTLQLVMFALLPLAQLPAMVIFARSLGVEFSGLKSIGRTFIHALVAIGFWLYLKKSVRVRNTFVR